MNRVQNKFDQIRALSGQAALNLSNITYILQSTESTDSEMLQEFTKFCETLEGFTTSIQSETTNFLHKPLVEEILTKDSGTLDEQGWLLIAVSEAARKHRSSIKLAPNAEYTVGRQRNNYIRIPSTLCSKKHCIFKVTNNEVIMIDMSSYGTRVNKIKHVHCQVKLKEGDLIGFGCSNTTAKLKESTDKQCFVYRLKRNYGTDQSETIELSDGSDVEDNRSERSNTSGSENDSANENHPSVTELWHPRS